MAFFQSLLQKPVSRRGFLKKSLWVAGGLGLYAGEIERHWIEIAERDVWLSNLPSAFEGYRIVQLSDIHMNEYTEPFFLRHAVEQINRLRPDAVFLTGDYISSGLSSHKYALRAGWRCAEVLKELSCRSVYAVLGNHDVAVDGNEVAKALESSGITVLRNSYLPLARGSARLWLAGLDDPVVGWPSPERAIPQSIRGIENEPVILLCHAPDYVDTLLRHPVGKTISLVLSGHTHGGQVRIPFVPPVGLPALGQKYIQGWFRFGAMQLYVNRGIGTVGVPFRFNCPPEITLLRLRAS
jgi:predicted MPP superfamily phosphohydrolase